MEKEIKTMNKEWENIISMLDTLLENEPETDSDTEKSLSNHSSDSPIRNEKK